MQLIGRERESAQLRELVRVISSGMSGVLVLRGEVGVGKSALLDQFAEDSADFQVVRLAGVEPEKHLSFAALNRLLLPFLGLVDRLPQEQRQALGSAFGLNQDAPSNPLLLGLSVLTLLAEVAQSTPLACVVDDAQWLDIDSLNVLAFVARRLHAEPVGMVFAARPIPELTALDGLPEINLEGLREGEALDLLISLCSGRIDHEEARRIAGRAGGNLLVLTEVGRALADGATPSELLVNDLLPVGQRLEAYFLSTVRTLALESQRLLLIAAAISDGDAGLLWRTADMAGIRPEAALQPEAMRLIEIRPEFRFRHPMIRSAIYFGASEDDRRSVHERLAMAIDEEYDPDLKAWHLAAAAIGYDQELADALDQCAMKAHERGGYLAEADVLTRSAALSPLRPQRAARMLAAAAASAKGGAYLRAKELLDTCSPLLDDPMLQARALRLDVSLIDLLGLPGGESAGKLLRSAYIFEFLDREFARDTLLEALNESHFRGGLMVGSTPAEVGSVALRFLSDSSSGDETAELVARSTATLYSSGFVSAAPEMKRAVNSLGEWPRDAKDTPQWRMLGSMLSQGLWDDKANRKWHERIYQIALRTGDFPTLVQILISNVVQASNRGELAAARIHLAELKQIARVQGNFDPQQLLAIAGCELSAWEGDEPAVRSAAGMMYAVAEALGSQLQQSVANRALMIIEIGPGNYEEAFSVASHSFETDLIPHDNWALPVLVEAGVRIGKRHEAKIALEELRTRATASGTPWALGLLARSEALWVANDAAEARYREAVRLLGEAEIPGDLARAHLLFGEWLRDRHRTSDSRFQLHAALELFEGMGANDFADRARRTLSSTGDRIRVRAAAPVIDLTPQEAQIPRQAAIGATNREIAAAMFISRHTVDYHLRGVFRKLGISSRRELTQVVEIEASLIYGRIQS